MKNLIRICSFLTLIVAFSFVSAKAQSIQRFEADIPFNFSVGDKTYDAGNYVLRLSNAPVGKVVTLENDKNEVVKTFFAMERGDAPTNRSFLRFNRNADDSLTLAKLFTPEKSFALPGASRKSKAKGGVFAGDSQTVSINLKSTY